MARDQRLSLPRGTGPKLARRRVILPFAPLFSEPKRRSRQLSELVYGQDFDVYGEQGHWLFGRARPIVPGSRRKGYVGWVDGRAMGEINGRYTHRLSSLNTPLFARPDLKSHIVMSLPMGAPVCVTGETDGFKQVGSGAYISDRHLLSIREAEENFVAVARRYLGQPYVWGGNGARGVDCSGLVQMSLTMCGIDCPRDADMQEAALGTHVKAPEIPGDLLFWPGHVGILATKRRLLHANAFHMSVVEEPLGGALQRMDQAGVHLRAVKRL